MVEYLRRHIDALLRLSHASGEPSVSIELREMADECRIMLCTASFNDLAAEVKQQTSDRLRLNARQMPERSVRCGDHATSFVILCGSITNVLRDPS
jgi:hypothetical protein